MTEVLARFILHAAGGDGGAGRDAARHPGESAVRPLIGGVMRAFAGQTVEEYAEAAHAYLSDGAHPTLGRGFRDCGYCP